MKHTITIKNNSVMAWEVIKNGNTEFMIDWDAVSRVNKSYWTARLMSDYSSTSTISDSSWYNPFSWSLPDLTQVETDFEAVSTDASMMNDQELIQFKATAETNVKWVAEKLERRIDEAIQYKKSLLELQQWASQISMQNIEKSVDSYESKIEVTKFVRDTSAEGLMVGASLLTGGTALAVMGTGSILKGAAKFEDTGSVAAGALEMTGSFAFAYIKLGKQFSFKQDMVLALVKGSVKTGTELLGGASFSKAALSGALKLTGPAVDKFFKADIMKRIFERASVPVQIMVKNGEISKSVTSSLAANTTAKLVQSNVVERQGKKYILGSTAQETKQTYQGNANTSNIDNFTFTNKFYLYFGIVNMENGIGRGW